MCLTKEQTGKITIAPNSNSSWDVEKQPERVTPALPPKLEHDDPLYPPLTPPPCTELNLCYFLFLTKNPEDDEHRAVGRCPS